MGKNIKKTPFADFLSQRDTDLQNNPDLNNFRINEDEPEVLEHNQNILNQQDQKRIFADQTLDYQSLLL